jgi:hypothetical protein
VLWHAVAFVCSPEVHDPSHYPPPTLLQFSAASHSVLIGFSGSYPPTCCTPNRRSNPIAHRVRRKHQRLPPSLLIENASNRVPVRRESVLPEAFPIKPSDNSSRTAHQLCLKKPALGLLNVYCEMGLDVPRNSDGL